MKTFSIAGKYKTLKLKNFKHNSAICSLSAIMFAMTCLPVYGQEAKVDKDVLTYQANFFTKYTPQNAMEMIQRLPGFSFDQGSNARGFGGNAGNVLIDGSRPTSKSGGLRGALVRIPAAQVERIEILRGGVGAGEAAGQSIVANVIRSKIGTSGTWALKFRHVNGANAEPNLEAAITTKLGQWDTSFDTDIGGASGYRSALFEDYDADGKLTVSADETMVERPRWWWINGEGSRNFADGKLTLTTRFGGDSWRGDPKRKIYEGRLPNDTPHDGFREFNDRNSNDLVELGADWTQTGDTWKWRLIGLGNESERNFSSTSHDENFLENEISNTFFSQQRKASEYIARTTFTLVNGADFKPEFGMEIASNELDTNLAFIQDGENIALENGNVIVEEQRSEAFATMVYDLSEKWDIEGGLTAEFSQIQLTGDTNQKQSFTYYKPRLSGTYQVNDDHRLTIVAERRVGQLNFNDFAASTDTSDEVTTSGNSNLQPDKTTELALTYDWSISERGSLKIKAFHEWRKDVLEQVILPSGGYGLGNAPSARFWGVVTDLNLPMDWLLPNALIEIKHRYRGSSFDDPITGENRNLSWYTHNWFGLDFRQDLTEHKMAWGVSLFNSFEDKGFRVNEIQTFGGNKRSAFFIETTKYLGLKIRLDIQNLNTTKFTRTRYKFEETRNGEFLGSQVSKRTRKPELKLSISGTF